MKRFLLLTLPFFLLMSVLVTDSRAANVYVWMLDRYFTPATVTIEAGDTVTWINYGVQRHRTTSGEDCTKDNLWDSGYLYPETPYTVKFNIPGSYHYFCGPPCIEDSMQGDVIVLAGQSVDDDPTLPPVEEVDPPSIDNPVLVPSVDPDGSEVEFTAYPTSGQAPLTVYFLTIDSDITATSWLWDFGDGATSVEQNPIHFYTSPGVYSVSLTVTDGVTSATETRTNFITASTDGPTKTVWHDWFAVDTRETPMVGDFNGDGMMDIITFTRDNPLAVGDVYVALSEGDHFGPNTFWNDWFAVSHDETVVIGDYNGDGVDDIATWLGKSSMQVYVAISYGTGANESVVWVDSIGENDDDVLKAGDVDGDGREDLVLFARHTGRVYVARSNGGGFDAPQVWHNWFAVSIYERPEVGDLDGDGRADIITFATDSPTAQGDVYVALSNGSGFSDGQNSDKWHDWFGVDPDEVVTVGDLNADGMDDLFTFMPSPSGQVYVAYSLGRYVSLGSYISENFMWTESFDGSESDVRYVGDVNADGKADLITFSQDEGKVYVATTP